MKTYPQVYPIRLLAAVAFLAFAGQALAGASGQSPR